ncbi:Alpha/beta hydrolase fold-1 [Macrophomina phaseolina]|uniref:Alpha/beta hydrolase fold-1 n=1 Tax=Macrophomina phaseolina TaxID=35725 RepID=A0ABQ8G1V9_9PEZI|nr:Alpha/beta hydrolase fold-1 [Macrophomina phaseolina]
MAKPTVVLVPGAWHDEYAYHKLVPDLERRGYATLAVRNPSLGQSTREGLIEEDAAHLRTVVDRLLADGKEVIVVAHSYAGSVLSSALADYAWKEGENGHVLGLVYIAAFLLPEGKNLASIMFPPDGRNIPSKADENGFKPQPDPYIFYNDLPESEQQDLVKHLHPNPANADKLPGHGVPWKNIPTIYIKCLRDLMLPPYAQQAMLDAVDAGERLRVLELDASHSPMLSIPERVSDAVALVEGLGREGVERGGLLSRFER